MAWATKKRILVAIAVVTVFLLGFETYTVAVVHFERNTEMPKNLGNFERIRNSLKDDTAKEKFSFAIVGDTVGSGTFGRLCDRLRNEPLAFMVIDGDFVDSPAKENHDYFRFTFSEACRNACPTFLLVGNHDVAYRAEDYTENRVRMIDFERMYGPVNFSFEYGGCLFVGLCTLPPPYSTEESLAFLDSTLEKHWKESQKVFVFTHMPLVMSSGIVTDSFENVQDFIDIIDRYKVDYIIMSHFHGYDRTERNGTVYLVTGGGGAPLEEEESFGGLHHAVVFTVDHGAVSEKVVAVRGALDINDTMRGFAVTKLFPVLAKHVSFTIAENIVIVGILFVCVWSIFRPRERHASGIGFV